MVNRIRSYTVGEMSEKIDNIELRITALEIVPEAVEKIWKFGKVIGPTILLALAFSINKDSPAGMFLTYIANHLPS